APQQRIQIAARDVFHHQIRARIRHEEIEDLRDSRMVKGCEQVCLALECLEHCGALARVTCGRQHLFDCDEPLGLRKMRVACLKDCTHTAAADDADDAV